MAKKSYAVFGMGHYGFSVARTLSDNGAQVLAVDSDAELIETVSPFIPLCKCADVTSAEAINQLGISNFDVVVVAMADNLEASVMAVTLAKEAGVPCVIAKCGNEMHKKILLRVGADKVVFPETESGTRLAKNLLSSGFLDIAELSPEVSIVEISVKSEWAGKSLSEIDLRKKYALNVIAENVDGKINVNLDPNKPLDTNSKLIVIAETSALEKLGN